MKQSSCQKCCRTRSRGAGRRKQFPSTQQRRVSPKKKLSQKHSSPSRVKGFHAHHRALPSPHPPQPLDKNLFSRKMWSIIRGILELGLYYVKLARFVSFRRTNSRWPASSSHPIPHPATRLNHFTSFIKSRKFSPIFPNCVVISSIFASFLVHQHQQHDFREKLPREASRGMIFSPTSRLCWCCAVCVFFSVT